MLPSATEIVCALGLGDRLVGRTHECDWPPAVAGVPAVTEDRLGCDPLDSAAIDRAVSGALDGGEGIYRLDREALARARPDLILTQELCEVCAVARDEVEAAACELPGRPRVLSLEPETLEGAIASVAEVGEAAGAPAAGRRLAARLTARLEALRARTAALPRRRVVCLEWLDPPYLAGHWVPQQVEAAGGHDPLGQPGRPSARARPERVAAAAPEALVLMCCGWGVEETLAALGAGGDPLAPYADTPALRAGRVVAVDAASYFSRPGPRLVDGAELLARVLHPGLDGPPPPGAARAVALATGAAGGLGGE